jgi:hypothetical protein
VLAHDPSTAKYHGLVLGLGGSLKLNSKVVNIAESVKSGSFEAAFLAVGAHIGKRAYLPAAYATKFGGVRPLILYSLICIKLPLGAIKAALSKS